MNTKDKTLQGSRVEDLLARYGSDPSRFPADDRDQALALMRGDESLRAAIEDAKQLDQLLDSSESPMPSADLMRRVAEIPLRHPKPVRHPGESQGAPPFHYFRAALAGLFAAALGVFVGIQSLPAAAAPGNAPAGGVIGAQLAAADDEMLSLAFADDFTLDLLAESGEQP